MKKRTRRKIRNSIKFLLWTDYAGEKRPLKSVDFVPRKNRDPFQIVPLPSIFLPKKIDPKMKLYTDFVYGIFL